MTVATCGECKVSIAIDLTSSGYVAKTSLKQHQRCLDPSGARDCPHATQAADRAAIEAIAILQQQR
jgi:hypothetical protein